MYLCDHENLDIKSNVVIWLLQQSLLEELSTIWTPRKS